MSAPPVLYIRPITDKLRFITASFVLYMRLHDVGYESSAPNKLGDGLEARRGAALQAPWRRSTGALVAPWRRSISALQA